MRAYEIHEFGIDKLKLVDTDEPVASPGQVAVKFHAASLNYRDVMVVSGTYNPRMKLPAIPLSDAAGEVVAIGEGVIKWQVGDRVMPLFAQKWFDGESSEEKRKTSLGAGSRWQGVLSEFAAFDQESVVRIPAHLSYEQAATLPCAALTAWNALQVSGRVRAGETVLTLGTGGVSVFAIQFAKMAGARVIATSGSDEKLAKLKELGADETINYRTLEDWDKVVLELTDRRGVDHVIEVGGAGTLARSISSVRIAGHVAMIGALTGAAGFDPITVFMKAIRLQGIFVGSRAMLEDMLRAVAENALVPVVDRVFSFAEARDALNYMASGAHFGKVVIKIGE